MGARDRIIGAAAWWIGLVGLIGLALKRPPVHPDAYPHCLFGFLLNSALLVLQLAARLSPSLSGLLWWAGALALLYALPSTVLALMGRPPLFFPQRASPMA